MSRSVGRFRVPTTPREVARFFLTELYSPRSGRERWAARVARRLPAAAGVGLLSLVSGRAGEPGELVLEPVLERSLGPPSVPPRDRPAVVELRGHPGSGRSVGFLFPAGESRPRWVVKQADAERDRGAIATEASLLPKLRDSVSPGLAEAIPRVLGLERSDRRTSVLLEALPGRPMHVEIARAAAVRNLPSAWIRAAGEWLGKMHRETAEARALPQDLRFDRSNRPAAREALIVCRAHGDYWPRNILVDPISCRVSGVVDWEASAPARLPHGDLFDFALTAIGCAPGVRGGPPPERVFGLAFLEDGPARSMISGFLASYSRETCLDRRFLEPLVRLYMNELSSAERDLPWVPASRRREVIRTWWSDLEAAGRSAFSG